MADDGVMSGKVAVVTGAGRGHRQGNSYRLCCRWRCRMLHSPNRVRHHPHSSRYPKRRRYSGLGEDSRGDSAPGS